MLRLVGFDEGFRGQLCLLVLENLRGVRGRSLGGWHFVKILEGLEYKSKQVVNELEM